MSDGVGFKVMVQGREFGAVAARTAIGWIITCRGARETLTATGRTILDAKAGLVRQIEQRLAQRWA